MVVEGYLSRLCIVIVFYLYHMHYSYDINKCILYSLGLLFCDNQWEILPFYEMSG